MPRHASSGELSQMLASRGQLIERGASPRALAARVRNGELTPIRRGWFVETAEFGVRQWHRERPRRLPACRPLPASDVTIVRGLPCTTLARTVFDTIRTTPLEAPVAIADAAERSMLLRGRE